jgi:putative toxin-antitoxin system antitoxin component (TIGR02293 family)
MKLSKIEKILGGSKFFDRRIRDRMDFIKLSEKGLTKEAVENLAKYLDLSNQQIAEILPVSARTLQRYHPQKRFNALISEHVLLIAEAAVKGTEVFGSRVNFLPWVKSPCIALRNKIPLSLLKTKSGIDMVKDELGRIEHGIIF